jgi:hypothetical protein
MKKFIELLTLALVLLPAFIYAQTEQGKIMVGLSTRIGVPMYTENVLSDVFSLSFSTIKSKSDADNFEEPDPDKITTINMLPRVGVFVIDGLAVGLDLSLANMVLKDGYDDDKTIQTAYALGPFVRYYFPVQKVKPFIEANGSFGSLKYKNEYSDSNLDDEEYKYSLFLIGGGAGVAIPIGKRASFDMMAGYNSLNFKEKEDNDDNYRTIIGTFGLKFGFIVFLGKDKVE